MSDKLRIIFMGTPEFAVASLKELVESECNVVAVITVPDKPAGRGQKILSSPVKEYAVAQGIKVLQPEKLKNAEFLQELADLKADLQIVVAFRMLPEVVWSMPKFGTFNLHGSLLPQYRGAAPINWAIINGDKESGVTTFFIEKEIDTGKIIFQAREKIHAHDDAGTLYERLMNIGAKLVVKTVDAIQVGNYPQEEQIDSQELNAAPKIFRETCEINWNQPSEMVHNFVRGLSPYPAAWTIINNLSCKVYQTSITEATEPFAAGTIQTDNKKYLRVMTADHWVNIESLQLQGKKRMPVGDFLRGTKVEIPS